MTADFHKTFDKHYQALSPRRQQQVKRVITLFLSQQPPVAALRDHPLKGEWLGYRSISAGGDLRIHYRVISSEKVLFVAVGTHSQLYR